MRRINTVIIGGGQAGLAMSRCLLERGIEHVVLERGRVGERWRSERWDSLRLLTPNWQTRLPGFRYTGPEPDGYMGMAELIGFLEQYAASFAAPIETGTSVLSVARDDDGFRVGTDRGEWRARHVVIATGYCDVPIVPAWGGALPREVVQVVPNAYRHPGELPEGGVLVVGASATGIQLAEEIHESGRPVTLAVGRHLRLPRTYRGRDILWWLDALGVFADSVDSVADVRASRRQPSLQLVGRPDRRSLDVARLSQQGVRLVGRLLGADGSRVAFDNDIIATTVAADLKLAQLLTRIDQFIAARGLEGELPGPEPFEPTWPAAFDALPTSIDLSAAGIRTVVWATGFRRHYPWLRIPVLDGEGEIRHEGGVTPVPGLYVLGLHFQRRRNSGFIDGVGADAEFLVTHIASGVRSRSIDELIRIKGGSPMDPEANKALPPQQPRRTDWGQISIFPKIRDLTPARRYDAVVVGGRCAGAGTAMLLARGGMDVLLVEQGTWGADTLSTLALMRGGVLQLARWGLIDKVRAARTPAIRTTTFHYGRNEVRIAIKPRDGVDALYAPRRTVLDPLLADAAQAAGADVRYRTRLVSLERDRDGRVSGVTIESGRERTHVTAGIVIGADGLHSTVAKQVGAEPYRRGAHASSVIYAVWSGLEIDGYHWHYAPGVSAGVIPTTGGDVLVFASAPRDRFMRELRHDLNAGFRAVVAAAAPDLAAALRTAVPRGPLRGFAGHEGLLRPAWGPGWALVGDAGYFKDPLTAHGITDALRDAELLAGAVLAGGDAALAAYQSTRDDLSWRLFGITDEIASFNWDMPRLQSLHQAFSEEMARETLHLRALPGDGCAPLARAATLSV
jgi:putative flavoprotein involved in K+ transport